MPWLRARLGDRLTRACIAGAAVGLVPFLLVLWDVGVRPLRRATAAGINADFFDVQARALLHGHLDVPVGSVGIEAFAVDGRHYLYFGPLPALLRMPVMVLTDRLDGRLTALSMLVGWFVLAAALTVLVGRVRRQLRGDAPVDRLEAIGVGAVVATVTGGSTVVYLASQPWVYHEVYVWSTALTVATVASLIAVWDHPSQRRIVPVAALALATMLTRVTSGWAMALALVVTGGCFLVGRHQVVGRQRAGWGLIVGGALVVVTGSLVNWAKFRHPYLFPIEDQVWTRLSAHRRLVLANNGGRLDGLRFVPTTLRAYLRPDGVRFVPYFPFVTPPANPPTPVGEVLLDESSRTGSIPALMPLLSLLAVWGAVVCCTRRLGAAALRIPLLACLAISVGVVAFGHVAQRYTSEFLPLLAVGAVLGVVDLAGRLDGRRPVIRRLAGVAVCVLAAYGIVANAAIGSVNARQHWRGDRLTALVDLQAALGPLTGSPLDERARHVAVLPPSGDADELAVVGDCAAVYLGTGETTGPWVPVAFRDQRFRLDAADAGVQPGSAGLMSFDGYTERRLLVQIGLDGRMRLAVRGAPPSVEGRWIDTGDGPVRITVEGDTAANRFVARAVSADGQVSVATAPMTEWDDRLFSVPITPSVAPTAGVEVGRLGMRSSASAGPQPAVCDHLR